jgi:hypothetical protein
MTATTMDVASAWDVLAGVALPRGYRVERASREIVIKTDDFPRS